MDPTIEELKFVADLAHNGGMMKAQNEALSADLTKLQTELNEKKVQLMEMQEWTSAIYPYPVDDDRRKRIQKLVIEIYQRLKKS